MKIADLKGHKASLREALWVFISAFSTIFASFLQFGRLKVLKVLMIVVLNICIVYIYWMLDYFFETDRRFRIHWFRPFRFIAAVCCKKCKGKKNRSIERLLKLSAVFVNLHRFESLSERKVWRSAPVQVRFVFITASGGTFLHVPAGSLCVKRLCEFLDQLFSTIFASFLLNPFIPGQRIAVWTWIWT